MPVFGQKVEFVHLPFIEEDLAQVPFDALVDHRPAAAVAVGECTGERLAELQAQGEKVDPERIQFLREQYGLDKPLYEQYLIWFTGFLRGDRLSGGFPWPTWVAGFIAAFGCIVFVLRLLTEAAILTAGAGRFVDETDPLVRTGLSD